MPAAFFARGVFIMLFDIITAVILFQFLRAISRLNEQRHGDVLNYVSKQNAPWARDRSQAGLQG